jgi:uncharacterized protein YjiS (DUF1127 family)
MSGLWQGCRKRAYLRRAIGNFHKLDDHLLRDIGLTRAEYCFSAHVSRDHRPRSIAKTAGIFTISRRLLSRFQA